MVMTAGKKQGRKSVHCKALTIPCSLSFPTTLSCYKRQPTPVFLPGKSHGQEPGPTVHRVTKSQTWLSDLRQQYLATSAKSLKNLPLALKSTEKKNNSEAGALMARWVCCHGAWRYLPFLCLGWLQDFLRSRRLLLQKGPLAFIH